MFVIGFCLALVMTVSGQQEGEPCTDSNTYQSGICTRGYQCESAKREYKQRGIIPTLCSQRQIVCCKDKSSILQVPKPNTDRPIWKPDNQIKNTKRVSERKCEEYSKQVVAKVEYTSLLLEPEDYSVTTAKCSFSTIGLIWGGNKTTPGEFPHMAAIGYVGADGEHRFDCGGSLISTKFVLTAGHCTSNRLARNPEPVIVRLGDQNLDKSVNDGARPTDVPIGHIHKYPGYDNKYRYNDIALFELVSDVTFDAHIRAACLWTRPTFGTRNKVIATGWGITEDRVASKDLMKVELDILDTKDCDNQMSHLQNSKWWGFSDAQMCAGSWVKGRDTCQGDSGGPIQVTAEGNQCIFYIVGITSFGKQCAVYPGVYTRVSSFVDWIEQTVWPGE